MSVWPPRHLAVPEYAAPGKAPDGIDQWAVRTLVAAYCRRLSQK